MSNYNLQCFKAQSIGMFSRDLHSTITGNQHVQPTHFHTYLKKESNLKRSTSHLADVLGKYHPQFLIRDSKI